MDLSSSLLMVKYSSQEMHWVIYYHHMGDVETFM